MKLKYHLLSALLASSVGVAAAASAAGNEIFLNIPGITGPVIQPGYVGDIPLLAYSQGFSNSSVFGAGGITVGKTQCGAVSFTKLIDSTSVLLLQHVVRSTVIPTVTLYFLPPATTGTTPAPYSITLSTVVVASISQGDSVNNSGGLGITESISLIAEKFAFSYRPLNGGVLGPPETTGWDCVKNAPF